jgi:hypothetical protein
LPPLTEAKRAKLAKMLGARPMSIEPREAVFQTAAAEIPASENSEFKNQALHSAALTMWAIFIELGEDGANWSDTLSSSRLRNIIKNTKVEKWKKLEAIREHVKYADAWKAFCTENSLNFKKPDCTAVELFTTSFLDKGPTMPKAAYNSMRWMETNIGLKAHTSSDMLRRATDPPEWHDSKREEPWEPLVWRRIEVGTQSKNIFIKAICLFFSFLFSTALRPVHLQRATLKITSFLELKIARGKRVVRGRQQPIFMGAPLHGVTGINFKDNLEQYLKVSAAGTESNAFFLADFLPENSGFDTAEGFAAKPMSQAKASKLVLKYLEATGIPREVLARVSGIYGIRHVMPSISDRAHTPDHERDMVGDWRDKQCRSTTPMRDRYSYARCLRHSELRESLLIIARRAFELSFDSLEDQTSWSWDHVYENWPSGGAGRFSSDVVLTTTVQDAVQIAAPKTGEVEEEESSSNSSSSDSQEEIDGESAIEAIYWTLPKATVAKLHACTEDTPACNRSFIIHSSGYGLVEALRTNREWCSACFASLPKGAKKWWRESSSPGA